MGMKILKRKFMENYQMELFLFHFTFYHDNLINFVED